MFATKKKEENLLRAVLNSPLAREVEAREVREIAARRAALHNERTEMDRAELAAYHAHEKAVAKGFAAHEAALAVLMKAKRHMGELMANRAGACDTYNRRIGAIEAELRETADPEIGEFIQEMRDGLDETLKMRAVQEMVHIRHPATGKITEEAGPPLVQPSKRAQAIREAIAAAEGMKLEPAQEGITTRLAALRDALPLVGRRIGND